MCTTFRVFSGLGLPETIIPYGSQSRIIKEEKNNEVRKGKKKRSVSYRSSIRLVVEFNRLQLAQKLTRQQPKLRGDGRVLQQPLKSNCWGAVRSREGCRKTQKKTTHTKRRRRRRNKKIYKKAWNGRRVMLVPSSSSSCGLSVFYFILYTIFVWFPSLCCFFFAKAPTILSTLTFGGDPRNSPADRRIKKTPEKKIKATSLKKKKKKKRQRW